jgi:hypothetical protein
MISSDYLPWSRRSGSEYATCVLNVASHILPGLLASGKPAKGKEEAVYKEAIHLAAGLIQALDDHILGLAEKTK